VADPQRKVIFFNGGHNSQQDDGLVGINQLIKSQGVEYIAGDPQLVYKIPGRSLFGSVGAVGQVQGLALATYDDGTTFLLAVGGQKLYYSDASNGATGTFTAVTMPDGDLDASTAKMTSAHFNNRWYLATGVDSGMVVESDGTVVSHGMYAPNLGKVTLTKAVVGSNEFSMPIQTTSHSAGVGQWWAAIGGDSSQDQLDIVAATRLQNTGETASVEFETTFTATFTNRIVELLHNIGDDTNVWQPLPGSNTDQSDEEKPWSVTVTVKKSENNGTTFSTVETFVVNRNWNGIRNTQIPVASATTASDQVVIRVELSATTIAGLQDVSWRAYGKVLMTDGAGATTYTNTAGNIYYAITEFDQTRGWESALSEPAQMSLDASTGFGTIEVSLPATARTANATHFNIYRTSNQNLTYISSEMGYVSGWSWTSSASRPSTN
jgi:hypothetical protein